MHPDQQRLHITHQREVSGVAAILRHAADHLMCGVTGAELNHARGVLEQQLAKLGHAAEAHDELHSTTAAIELVAAIETWLTTTPEGT